MKILVFSDSHGNTANISAVLKKSAQSFEMAVHLGDFYGDMDIYKAAYPALSFFCVAGNNDYGTNGPDELIIEAHGHKILLTHGHKHNIYFSYDRLSYLAEEKRVSTCLFGHTHIAEVFTHNSILFMNPGSIYRSRDNYGPTYAVLDISEKGVIKPSVIEIHRGLFRVRQM